MANWDNVPWMVGGGVQHSTNIARLLAYAAFNGEPGVIGPGDLEVRELAPSPGSSVQVYKGACSILNHGTNIEYEAYVARLLQNDTIAISPNNSTSAARSDLVYARVDNPWQDTNLPQPASGQEQSYDYVHTAVLSGVSSTSKGEEIASQGYTGIPLARIDIPANTVTIQQSMIHDLRQLTQVRHEENLSVIAPTTTQNLSSSSYTNWPSAANMDIDVPVWATHLQVQAILGGILYGQSGGAGPYNVIGNIRVQLGLDSDSDVSYGQGTAYNVHADSGIDRATLMTGVPMLWIPKTKRGTTTQVRLEAQKTGGNDTLTSDAGTMISLLVKFLQAPESNV